MIRITGRAAALCCTLALAACFPPVTTHPVGTPEKPDPALAGLWKATMSQSDPGENQAYFHFVPRTDGTLLVVIVSAHSKDGDVMAAKTTTTRIGNAHYMNATLLAVDKDKNDTDEMPPGTMPVFYRLDDARHLTLCLMDEDKTKAAINAHKIKGTVGSGAFGDATITADKAELDAFLATPEGRALFNCKDAKLATMVKMD